MVVEYINSKNFLYRLRKYRKLNEKCKISLAKLKDIGLIMDKELNKIKESIGLS